MDKELGASLSVGDSDVGTSLSVDGLEPSILSSFAAGRDLSACDLGVSNAGSHSVLTVSRVSTFEASPSLITVQELGAGGFGVTGSIGPSYGMANNSTAKLIGRAVGAATAATCATGECAGLPFVGGWVVGCCGTVDGTIAARFSIRN